MRTDTRNLEAAAAHWDMQAAIAAVTYGYVVAQPSGLRVLATNMAVMLAGAAAPEMFGSESVARAHAQNLARQAWDFDGEPALEAMTYKQFCSIQAARFETALQTVRVADALAAEPVAA
jgi:hypothetical protein